MLSGVIHRPLAVRKRPDLVAGVEQVGVRRLWRVKDPVSLEYFEFSEQEYAILDMLDGRATLAQIKQRFEQDFAPLQLSFVQLESFLSGLFQAGLVSSLSAGQGQRLLERRREARRSEAITTMLNLLAFRIRGVDPQRFLNWLEPRTRFLFSTWFLGICVAIVASAVVLLGVEFDHVRSRVPAIKEFLTPTRVIWLGLALTTAKLVHELAHALTCRHFGGECHELGIMFLVFTPCLYCNVSDSWMLAGRWPRIAISAAGVIVELVLAAVCAFFWWFSQPGLFNSVCLNLMIVCSISTLVFNGNPLLRYDGYFVLSDLVRESNLAQKSGELLRNSLEEWCLGIPFREQSWHSMSQPLMLAIYGVLSTAYRGFVLALILWFCHAFFREQQLPTIGRLLVLSAVAGVLYRPVASGLAILRDPLRRRRFDRNRMAWLAGFVAVLGLAACLIPLPRYVAADVVLEARGARRVYVPVPGRLAFVVAAGSRVRQGDILARLSNPTLTRELERLTGERNQAELQLKEFEARRADDPLASAQLPAVRETLTALARRLQQKRVDVERLLIRAPSDGVVLPPPVLDRSESARRALPQWRGTPLDDKNANCWLETGTFLCQLGEPDRIEPVLVINQADVDFVRRGQQVRLQIDQRPAEILSGTVSELAAINMDVIPRDLSNAGEMVVRYDTAGIAHPLEASYQARVSLNDGAPRLLLRGAGHARIAIDPTPLAIRMLRILRQTFHFKL